MKKQPEFELQKAVVKFIRLQYPKVLFLSDTVAFLKLTLPQASRNKSIQCADFHCPDLLILQPNGQFHGLFIELKAESPFKKDGTLYKNEHLENQQKTINRLNELGYKAMFAWEFETIKRELKDFLR